MTRKKLLVFTLTLSMIFAFSGSALAAFPKQNNPIISIVKNAYLAVVNIDVEKVSRRSVSPFPFDDDDNPFFKHFFGDSFKDFTRSVPMKGRGSGFIVTRDGQILTNNHVVDGVDKITVSVLLADGSKKTYSARILGSDPTYDLAVIKIDANVTLPVLELGDSDKLEVGEWVVAIGNPYGFEHSVTAGVISAKNRSIHTQEVNFDDFLQTDAAINPGNSGGPLLDMDGKVVGINTAIIPYAQGLGFAIPVNKAKEIINDLVSYGRVKRGWLGVSIRDINDKIAKAYGVEGTEGAIVGDVFRGDPAEKAGIKRGDVVIEINGTKIKDANSFVQKVRTLAPNSTAKLVIIRKGKKMTVNVKLGERPNTADGRPEGSERNERNRNNSRGYDALKDFGILRVAPLNDSLRRQYRISSGNDGLVITEIDRNSQASSDGEIRVGDLILEVNSHEVKNLEDLRSVVGRDDFVVLMIEREGSTFIVMINKQGKD